MKIIALKEIAQATQVIPSVPGGSENFDWGNSVSPLIQNITTIALDIVGGIAMLYMIIGAIQYFTAYGDESKATAGKTTLLWAIVGLVVIVVSRIIIGWVFSFVTTTSAF
ncbi:TPA: hypothetical protein DD449_04060 [Candidatus Berkelbacteria bacterium]|uniref:Uncharacterized protein n=1 Tax=Berkelbacteria bacterium GW2011_GWE1_39_12 TaxID=1618337 RepID=A0A0G4B3X1_9BACT|nr:MAG: conserved membrane protein of unknown function [Berkelbacteria bacterium GW2011_GWE1_39_12]HBO60832.1 hypothetical protein [Candidatus Berkelbacteria bacterium]